MSRLMTLVLSALAFELLQTTQKCRASRQACTVRPVGSADQNLAPLAGEVGEAIQSLARSEGCEFGSLPGRWTPGGHYDVIWQLEDATCQLAPLVDKVYQHKTVEGCCERQLGILLFGDSNDRRMVTVTCQEAGEAEQPFNIELDQADGAGKLSHTCYREGEGVVNCNTCSLPGLRITREAIWGFNRANPFHEGRIGFAPERVQKGLELFKEQHGALPDLIVIQSALWDLASIWHADTQDGKRPAQILANESLPTEWLDEWKEGVTAVFEQLKEAIGDGDSILAWRTTAGLRMRDDGRSQWHKYETMGQKTHLAQLNAAARTLALEHCVTLIDAEAMTAGEDPELYLEDPLHHKPYLNSGILNMYLNLLRERVCTGCSDLRGDSGD